MTRNRARITAKGAQNNNFPNLVRVVKLIDALLIKIIDGMFARRQVLRVPVASFSCPGFLGDGIGRAVAT